MNILANFIENHSFLVFVVYSVILSTILAVLLTILQEIMDKKKYLKNDFLNICEGTLYLNYNPTKTFVICKKCHSFDVVKGFYIGGYNFACPNCGGLFNNEVYAVTLTYDCKEKQTYIKGWNYRYFPKKSDFIPVNSKEEIFSVCKKLEKKYGSLK